VRKISIVVLLVATVGMGWFLYRRDVFCAPSGIAALSAGDQCDMAENRSLLDDRGTEAVEGKPRRGTGAPAQSAQAQRVSRRQSEHRFVVATVRPLLQTNLDYSARLQAVRALKRELSRGEIEGLFIYLQSRGPEKGLAGMQERYLKNTVMDRLIEQKSAASEVTEGLIAVYRDREQDEVIRDYAVQHLGRWYEIAPEEQRDRIEEVLWEAVGETDNTIAGTALLALRRLARTHPELDKSAIGRAALEIAGSEDCGEAAQRTALQICGLLGMDEIAPVAFRLAKDAGSVPLRISAIAALGYVGKPETADFLRTLAKDPRLRPAVDTALKRLEERRNRS